MFLPSPPSLFNPPQLPLWPVHSPLSFLRIHCPHDVRAEFSLLVGATVDDVASVFVGRCREERSAELAT